LTKRIGFGRRGLGWLRAGVAILLRPGLWSTALKVLVRMTPRRWWSHPPFLPVPSRDYLRFRLETQYGSSTAPTDPNDVLEYLSWVKQWDRGR